MPNSTIAALCLLALFTGEACAAAARVDFAYGDVTVAGPDRAERPLVRGAELDNDHIVRTAEGRAQLRFADGAYVSLQPHSEFAIRDYRFNGKTDGAERGFFALTKGAMRTVTGLIGRVHRDRYQVDTPTATIGIRGTGGVIQVLDDGSTLIVGTSGIWSLSNAAGSVDVPAGVSALAPASPDTAPQQTSRQPQAGPAPVAQATAFQQGEERTAAGRSALVPAVAPLKSAQGYEAQFAYGVTGVATPRLEGAADATAQFDASGRLIQLDAAPTSYRSDGTHADFGSDGILAWGRWIGPVTAAGAVENYPDNQGLHYVVGMPTATLPTNGSAKYVLAGATRPTFVNASGAPGSFAGELNVSFGAQATIDGTFSATMPSTTYAWTASGSTTSASFSLATTSSSGCAGACAVSTQGFFAGASVERAGITYHVQDGSTAVIGAAAFRKQ